MKQKTKYDRVKFIYFILFYAGHTFIAVVNFTEVYKYLVETFINNNNNYLRLPNNSMIITISGKNA